MIFPWFFSIYAMSQLIMGNINILQVDLKYPGSRLPTTGRSVKLKTLNCQK
jgi:hypothetical protein